MRLTGSEAHNLLKGFPREEFGARLPSYVSQPEEVKQYRWGPADRLLRKLQLPGESTKHYWCSKVNRIYDYYRSCSKKNDENEKMRRSDRVCENHACFRPSKAKQTTNTLYVPTGKTRL